MLLSDVIFYILLHFDTCFFCFQIWIFVNAFWMSACMLKLYMWYVVCCMFMACGCLGVCHMIGWVYGCVEFIIQELFSFFILRCYDGYDICKLLVTWSASCLTDLQCRSDVHYAHLTVCGLVQSFIPLPSAGSILFSVLFIPMCCGGSGYILHLSHLISVASQCFHLIDCTIITQINPFSFSTRPRAFQQCCWFTASTRLT